MTYVVTERCIGCKFTDCVDVCPVDCFHEGPNMLVIDPEECIDCGVCVGVCDADAIVSAEDLSRLDQLFIGHNKRLSAKWPLITESKEPPADAKVWLNKSDKRRYLKEA